LQRATFVGDSNGSQDFNKNFQKSEFKVKEEDHFFVDDDVEKIKFNYERIRFSIPYMIY
jgi:hypothetical protein